MANLQGLYCRVADGAADSEAGYDSEEEPSWELPDELQEYDGDPADRKTIVAFRQAQQVWPSSQAVPEVEDRGISMSWLCEELPNGLSSCFHVDCVAPLRVPNLPNNIYLWPTSIHFVITPQRHDFAALGSCRSQEHQPRRDVTLQRWEYCFLWSD